MRHGEAGDTAVVNTLVPGPALTSTGMDQANAVADVLKGAGIDEIFASAMTRAQQTAAPLATDLGLPVHVLPGLDEINAGVFEGIPVNVGPIPLGGAVYLLAPALWTLGLWVVPELGSSDFDGMAFESRFSGAVDTLYALSAANSNGAVTDAVFSHEGAITIWTLMNVNNPDFPLVATELFTTGQLLPYTGIVEVRGDPADGWTLVSWNGAPVPQDPGLPTDLFVDVRDLITAPQMAAYTVGESLLTGDLTTILTAVGGAVGDVGAATVHFPIAVIDDIVNAVTGALAAL
ncbi:histidine phosphatase family protein [Mycobacterium sp.]|uniref:histidine phosphatase family protein n=2 Tax=Mycobacterium sp. TaxID=1785 RepID=UPI0031E3A861